MIGITATVPVEIVFSAGLKPIDLNNLFISSDDPKALVSQAEAAGFSHNTCAWIKGIYSTVINQDIKKVIAVTGGDCSNTIVLGELLARRGVAVMSFAYPLNREREPLRTQMDKLRHGLSTTWDRIKQTKSILDRIRRKLKVLDRLTWVENVVTGSENHLFLVNSSDFNGDPEKFEKDLDKFLLMAKKRAPLKSKIRLGCLGVPAIFNQFHDVIESMGTRVVFNEVQRQFSMPFDHKDIVDQYLEYTYPYDINGRLKDIEKAVKERQLDGLIHYTQTFCYRQLYDIIIRKDLGVPVLSIEGDLPGQVDGRTSLRLETFVEMLKENKNKSGLVKMEPEDI